MAQPDLTPTELSPSFSGMDQVHTIYLVVTCWKRSAALKVIQLSLNRERPVPGWSRLYLCLLSLNRPRSSDRVQSGLKCLSIELAFVFWFAIITLSLILMIGFGPSYLSKCRYVADAQKPAFKFPFWLVFLTHPYLGLRRTTLQNRPFVFAIHNYR